MNGPLFSIALKWALYLILDWVETENLPLRRKYDIQKSVQIINIFFSNTRLFMLTPFAESWYLMHWWVWSVLYLPFYDF